MLNHPTKKFQSFMIKFFFCFYVPHSFRTWAFLALYSVTHTRCCQYIFYINCGVREVWGIVVLACGITAESPIVDPRLTR